MAIQRKTKGSPHGTALSTTISLADVIVALKGDAAIPATRLRDLCSAVQRVAGFLGERTSADRTRSAGDQHQTSEHQSDRVGGQFQDPVQPPLRLPHRGEAQWIEADAALDQGAA